MQGHNHKVKVLSFGFNFLPFPSLIKLVGSFQAITSGSRGTAFSKEI